MCDEIKELRRAEIKELKKIARNQKELNISVWIIVGLMVVIQFVFNNVAGIFPW